MTMVDKKFLFVESQDSVVWNSFWKESLRNAVTFLKSQGIHEYKDLSRFNARALVEPPLWRLPEINGKYHTRFYSRQVWERSLLEGRLPSRSGGKWSSPRAEVLLEHVVERAPLIEWIFDDPTRIDQIEDVVIGCVVTKDESKALPSKCGVNPNDLWKRYTSGRIDAYDRLLDRWHVLDGMLQ